MPKTQTTQVEETAFDLPKRRRPSAKSSLPWILLVIVLLGAGLFVYKQKSEGKKLQQQLMDLKQNPQKATEEETKSLLDKVGQLVELPDEQPTVATVTDLAPLKDQPFFAHAQIGDKVLIFSAAKKAILYRPSTNKVIEIAPVNLDNPPADVNTKTGTKATSSTDTTGDTGTTAKSTTTTKTTTTPKTTTKTTTTK